MVVIIFLLVLWRRQDLRGMGNFGRFAFQSAGLWLLCLMVFIRLSVEVGLMQAGTVQNVSIPADYVARGAVGWGILLIGAFGALSPLWVSLLDSKRH